MNSEVHIRRALGTFRLVREERCELGAPVRARSEKVSSCIEAERILTDASLFDKLL